MKLYYTLIDLDLDARKIDMERMAKRLDSLDKKHETFCILLILFHYKKNNIKTKELRKRAIPYSGNTISKKQGAKFSFDYFPRDLQEILFKFIHVLENSN